MEEQQRHIKPWGFEDWLYDDGKILLKHIHANSSLSIQVHPSLEASKTVGGQPKTEMWYVLEPGPIFAGFKPSTTVEEILKAISTNTLENLLNRIETKVGQCYLIPAGLVHAIGKGTSVFEVQQSSDTTFRLYDWGRLDRNGKPRQLHIDQALKSIDISLPPPKPSKSIDCQYFSFNVYRSLPKHLDLENAIMYDPQSNRVLKPTDETLNRPDSEICIISHHG